jgi:hypothetical protein
VITERQFGLGLIVLGALLGVIGDRFLLAVQRGSAANEVKALLRRELEQSVAGLTQLDRTLKMFPASLGAIAAEIETVCKREGLEACRRDLPAVGSDVMNKVLAFYDQARSVPLAFRGIETERGNIRATLVDDNLQHLVDLGRAAIGALR